MRARTGADASVVCRHPSVLPTGQPDTQIGAEVMEILLMLLRTVQRTALTHPKETLHMLRSSFRALIPVPGALPAVVMGNAVPPPLLPGEPGPGDTYISWASPAGGSRTPPSLPCPHTSTAPAARHTARARTPPNPDTEGGRRRPCH